MAQLHESVKLLEARLSGRSIEELCWSYNLASNGFFRAANNAVKTVDAQNIAEFSQLVQDKKEWQEKKEIPDSNLYGRLFEYSAERISELYEMASEQRFPKGFLISPKNCNSLLELAFEKAMPEWKNASREEKINLIENQIVNYHGKKRNGMFAWFEERHLKGLLLKGPFAKRASPLYILEWFDRRVEGKSWFNLNEKVHLHSWQMETGWRSDEEKVYTAIKHTLEDSIPDFSNSSREKQIELVRDHVINYKSEKFPGTAGSYQWLNDHGLWGVLHSELFDGKLTTLFKWFDRKYSSERNQLAWFAPALIYIAQRISRGRTPSLYVASGAETL